MAKRSAAGFTLLELLIALAVSLAALHSVAPVLDGFMQRQQLRMAASQVTAQIQSAKNMAASTECRSRVSLTQQDSDIQITIQLLLDTQWMGCRRWLEAQGAAAVTEVDYTSHLIKNTQLASPVSFEFQGVSGSLNNSQSRSFRLESGGQAMILTLDGIGNGVHHHVN
jgi:prepilin-type N-terminal cleavage/methylation domain-containing protein